MLPSTHYNPQPPQKFHRRYLHSALRYLDEAPRNFFEKKFYAVTLPPTLPERQSIPTHTAGSTGQPPVRVICIPRPMHVP